MINVFSIESVTVTRFTTPNGDELNVLVWPDGDIAWLTVPALVVKQLRDKRIRGAIADVARSQLPAKEEAS